MRVCVVGGTGNISSGIVQLLIELGHEVTCYNRGQTPGLHPKAKLITGDRNADPQQFEKQMQAEQFDAAIDMICFNKEQAESDLRAFKNVKHFVQCSTVCTFGVDYDWLPVSEDHPLRPITDYGRGKVAADNTFLVAFHQHNFPVTIIKPSTTYGPAWSMLRQVSLDDSWVSRVQQGKPIVVCGDAKALHQFLYADDAAPAFVYALGRERCLGQTYNMVRHGFTTWADYHKTAMQVIGREVELVGVPLATLRKANVPDLQRCENIFSHNTIYSCDKINRDIPEFQPKTTLAEGLSLVYKAMKLNNRIPECETGGWEDKLIAAQQNVGQ